MRRYIFLFIFAIALALSAPGYADEPVPSSGTTIAIGELVPSAPGATVADVKKIASDERKKVVAGVKKENQRLLAVKDIRVGKAIEEQTNKFVESSKNNASKADTKNLGEYNALNSRILGGVIVAGFIILGILVLRRRNRRNNNVPAQPVPDRTNEIVAVVKAVDDKLAAGLEKLSQQVAEVPEKTAENIKKIDMTPLDFETENHSVIFQLTKDKNGLLKSICVPKSIRSEYSDESIPTYSFDHRGKLFSKMLKVITAYLAGEYMGKGDVYSRMQTKAIEFAMKDGGPLKIR